jgi:hypothetical protein
VFHHLGNSPFLFGATIQMLVCKSLIMMTCTFVMTARAFSWQ